MDYKPKLHFTWARIQLNFEKSCYDYFGVNLFVPYFETDKFIELEDSEKTTTYSFNAPTTVSFVSTRAYWSIKAQLLGFGIGFSRQNGY